MQKIRIIGFLFENRLRRQFQVENISTNGYFRLHIYLRTNKPLIHLEFGNTLASLGTPSAVTICSMYLRLNLSTTPDLKF
jgi:hypothetical protein